MDTCVQEGREAIENDRPITVLPLIDKIFEHLLCKQITASYDHIMYSKVTAYRKNTAAVRVCRCLIKKVINYLIKCFSYCVHQHRNQPREISREIKKIVPHAFGNHEKCSLKWCRFKRDPVGYIHKKEL